MTHYLGAPSQLRRRRRIDRSRLERPNRGVRRRRIRPTTRLDRHEILPVHARAEFGPLLLAKRDL